MLGLIGMPGSGKGECAKVAKANDIPIINMGDVVREFVKSLDLELKDENVGKIANSEREKFDYGIWARRTLEKINALELQNNKLVVIDGIRGVAEIEVFKGAFDNKFFTIAVKMPAEKRFELLKKRKRADAPNTFKEFEIREARESKWGIKQALEDADFILLNTGTLTELEDAFKELLSIFKK